MKSIWSLKIMKIDEVKWLVANSFIGCHFIIGLVNLLIADVLAQGSNQQLTETNQFMKLSSQLKRNQERNGGLCFVVGAAFKQTFK